MVLSMDVDLFGTGASHIFLVLFLQEVGSTAEAQPVEVRQSAVATQQRARSRRDLDRLLNRVDELSAPAAHSIGQLWQRRERTRLPFRATR
jgi:hypothetical protein